MFGNPHKFYTEANPKFFEGTAIASKLAAASRVVKATSSSAGASDRPAHA